MIENVEVEQAPFFAKTLASSPGKSLVVDDPRYVYHDVEGGRWFGAYHRANESFLFLNVT